jgi:hypothetical protein
MNNKRKIKKKKKKKIQGILQEIRIEPKTHVFLEKGRGRRGKRREDHRDIESQV